MACQRVLRDEEDWLNYQHVVPPQTRISFVVALGLMVVCAVNTVGLLLAGFMRRPGDIGARRAARILPAEAMRVVPS
jgi:putative ABC transport system permease protein